jgi:DNA-binding NarL/FixJ family response regulator/tRNA A-37 threonylcarbamoyl transferase component Bud32
MFSNIDIPIVLTDDEKILRYGLRMTLEAIPGVRIVGEANNGQQAIDLVMQLRPAIVFMDIRMPVMSGVEATKFIKQQVPETRIIMFTSNDDEGTFRAALSAGADAYCLKDSTEQQLLGAIHAVLQGAKWLDSKLATDLVNSSSAEPSKDVRFSAEQKRILDLLDKGYELTDVAKDLGIGVTSVKYQLQGILRRLQPPSEADVVISPSDDSAEPEEDSRNGKGFPNGDLIDNLVGRVLSGKYSVESWLGSGGMSVVYKGRHIFMNKEVAIKTIHPKALGDIASIGRLKMEAMAASSITHSNIVMVLDFDIDNETQAPYLVMDYVKGHTLETVLANSPNLSVADSVQIFRQIAEALNALHSKNIVHRDLKPSNIMLMVANGSDVVVKLLDFGIAKFIAADAPAFRLTKTGEIFGSPSYMSPEQCAGRDIDQSSDFYSLGCLMYEVLTGRPPFQSSNAYNVMWQHVHEPPSRLPFLKKDVFIPDKLQTILFRLLSKDSAQRPQRAGDLVAELTDVLSEVQ